MSIRRSTFLTLVAVALAAGPPGPLHGQAIRGTVVDASNGRPVALAGIYLLDVDRDPVTMTIADSLGRYVLEVPDSAEYVLFAQRLGYFETESPRVVVSNLRDYELDFELRPEPIALDPLTVTVRNEEFIDWWRLEYGGSPYEVPGFRLIQGQRLEEAKMRAQDNTETLRFLYIPIWHGRQVCIGSIPGSRAVRSGWRRPDAEEREKQAESCGSLYLDGRLIPTEHLESIDMRTIAVVATYHGVVHLYTRGFNWAFRRP